MHFWPFKHFICLPSYIFMQGLHLVFLKKEIFPLPYGAKIRGVSGPNSPIVLIPCAAAICIGPVSFEIKREQRPTNSINCPRPISVAGWALFFIKIWIDLINCSSSLEPKNIILALFFSMRFSASSANLSLGHLLSVTVGPEPGQIPIIRSWLCI